MNISEIEKPPTLSCQLAKWGTKFMVSSVGRYDRIKFSIGKILMKTAVFFSEQPKNNAPAIRERKVMRIQEGRGEEVFVECCFGCCQMCCTILGTLR